jgi:hypothetical protein
VSAPAVDTSAVAEHVRQEMTGLEKGIVGHIEAAMLATAKLVAELRCSGTPNPPEEELLDEIADRLGKAYFAATTIADAAAADATDAVSWKGGAS